jgi:hypothetical protein
MTRPGDPGRPMHLLEGDAAQVVAKAVELVGTVPGASSFELKYDARDRVLAENEEPTDDEAVVWTATAQLRRRYARGMPKVTTTRVGVHIYDPATDDLPGGHAQAGVLAVVALLEELGANVVLLDQLRNPTL